MPKKLLVKKSDKPITITIKKKPKKITAISLFSGLGGDSLGLKNAGCEVIAYNELDKHFCLSHDKNFPNSERITENNDNDITKISDETISKYNDKVDILFAGFPCQGFSNAGKKLDNDPRNTLFREFLRFARITRPSMIIGENVKGLLSRKTSSGQPYVDVIVSEFEKIGYHVNYKVLKTEKYGIPQKRERLIIIGTLKDNKYNWISKFPDELSIKPNLKNIIKYDMRNTLKVNSKLFQDIPNECLMINMEDDSVYDEDNSAHPYLKRLYTANEELRSYDGKIHETLFSFGKRASPIHGEIIDIRNPSKTIICSYDHQPRFFVPIKNKSGCYLRVILPDELKQIQGFPSNYIVEGTEKQKVVQIGNAVPPPLIELIVKNITS